VNPTPSPTTTAPFRLGERGPAVVEVRDRLVRLGLLDDCSGEHGDTFDAPLDRAVRQFQQQRGLTVDGVVGAHTFRRLEEARWQLGDRVLSYRAGLVIAGDDVAALQRRLAKFGFDLGRVDGMFGPRTDAALREFQRSVGVSADGTCGPDSFRALARLARTVGGEGSPVDLRELSRLEHLATGVADKVVVLDPGRRRAPRSTHAPAVDGLTEALVADDLADRVEGRLAAIGVQVLLTRAPGSVSGSGGASPDQAAQAAFANTVNADLVLSLHVDSLDTPLANGLATFYYGDSIMGTGSALGARAAAFLQEELTSRTDLADCRTHAKSWDLLRLTRMPTVQVECGYLTSPYDAVRLADTHFRDAVAEGIAAAVVRFFAPEPVD
jgi:N-acetylmuramoyl-L-alanine amidase